MPRNWYGKCSSNDTHNDWTSRFGNHQWSKTASLEAWLPDSRSWLGSVVKAEKIVDKHPSEEPIAAQSSMDTETQIAAAEVSFVVFRYHPRSGDQASLGFAAFDVSTPFRTVLMRRDYWSVVTVLGNEQEAHVLLDILNRFSERFLNSAQPQHAMSEMKWELREIRDIFEFSDCRIAFGPTVDSVVDTLGAAYWIGNMHWA